MDEIMRAIGTLQNGDREAGRAALLELWDQHRQTGSARERSTIAHFLADTEEDVAAELAWDLEALKAATGGRTTEDRDPVEPDLATFLPSLHLNVADAYRRMFDLPRARQHAEFGLARAVALKDDGYGRMIRSGLERLKASIAAAAPLADPPRHRRGVAEPCLGQRLGQQPASLITRRQLEVIAKK